MRASSAASPSRLCLFISSICGDRRLRPHVHSALMIMGVFYVHKCESMFILVGGRVAKFGHVHTQGWTEKKKSGACMAEGDCSVAF